MKKVINGYEHITPEILSAVKVVLDEYNKDTYSVSRIYGAHNAVMQLNETGQSCRTCLQSRAKALAAWFEEYEAAQTPDAMTQEQEAELMGVIGITTDNTFGEYGNALGAYLAHPIPDENMRALYDAKLKALYAKVGSLQSGTAVTLGLQKVDKETGVAGGDTISAVFTPTSDDDATKGTIINSGTGKALAAGTYLTTEDAPRTLGVQPGGKAVFKVEDLT